MARINVLGQGIENDTYNELLYWISDISLSENHEVVRKHNLDLNFRWFLKNLAVLQTIPFKKNVKYYVGIYFRDYNNFISIMPKFNKSFNSVRLSTHLENYSFSALYKKNRSIIDEFDDKAKLPQGYTNLNADNDNIIYIYDTLGEFIKSCSNSLMSELTLKDISKLPPNAYSLYNIISGLLYNIGTSNMLESLKKFDITLNPSEIDPIAYLFDNSSTETTEEILTKFKKSITSEYVKKFIMTKDIKLMSNKEFNTEMRNLKNFIDPKNDNYLDLLTTAEFKKTLSTKVGTYAYLLNEFFRKMFIYIKDRDRQDRYFFENMIDILNTEINRAIDKNVPVGFLYDRRVVNMAAIMAYLYYIKLANEINAKAQANSDKANNTKPQGTPTNKANASGPGKDPSNEKVPGYDTETEVDSTETDPVDYDDAIDNEPIRESLGKVGSCKVEGGDLTTINYFNNDNLKKWSIYEDMSYKDRITHQIINKKKIFKTQPKFGGIIPKITPPPPKRFYNTILIDTSGSCFHMLEVFIADVYSKDCISEIYTYDTRLHVHANNVITNKKDMDLLLKTFKSNSGGTSLDETLNELKAHAKETDNRSLYNKTLFVFTDGFDSSVDLTNHPYKRIVVYYTHDPIEFINNVHNTHIINIYYNK